MGNETTSTTPEKNVTETKETKETTVEITPDIQKLIDAAVQSEGDKVRTEYSKKMKSLEKDIKAKMTEEEIKIKELTDRENAIAEKEALQAKKEAIEKTKEQLNSKGINANFIDYLMDADNEKIDKFDKLFKAEIEKVVNERLAGSNPKASTNTNTAITKDDFKKMSYMERNALFHNNPELYKQLSKL